MGKGENTCEQHFSPFPLFSEAFVFCVTKSQDCAIKRVNRKEEKKGVFLCIFSAIKMLPSSVVDC